MAYKASAKTPQTPDGPHQPQNPCPLLVTSATNNTIDLGKKNMIRHQPEKFGEFGWWINVD